MSVPAAPAGFVGPIYCDTAHLWMGIHEPVNTISNAAILIAAWLAYRHVKKSGVGFSGDLVLLIFLLSWVGIGSALWHGLRTRWALTFDWVPGVLYLLVLTVMWIRHSFRRAWLGWLAGIGGMLAMIAITFLGIRRFGPALGAISPNLRFAPMFVVVAVFGAGMTMATWRHYGRNAGLLGISILGFGIGAAVARSIDVMVCPSIPFGTHFLWHMGLSTAAFLGLFLIVKMKHTRALLNQGSVLP